jgi:hypothetical protein
VTGHAPSGADMLLMRPAVRRPRPTPATTTRHLYLSKDTPRTRGSMIKRVRAATTGASLNHGQDGTTTHSHNDQTGRLGRPTVAVALVRYVRVDFARPRGLRSGRLAVLPNRHVRCGIDVNDVDLRSVPIAVGAPAWRSTTGSHGEDGPRRAFASSRGVRRRCAPAHGPADVDGHATPTPRQPPCLPPSLRR